MGVPPEERKLLPKVKNVKLEPIFLDSWDYVYDSNNPELTLRVMKKRDRIEGTPEELRRINSNAWLFKFLIEKWHSDETERCTRDYLGFLWGRFSHFAPNFPNCSRKSWPTNDKLYRNCITKRQIHLTKVFAQ
jgi:hypothetical protein